jgi:hypothetical protein
MDTLLRGLAIQQDRYTGKLKEAIQEGIVSPLLLSVAERVPLRTHRFSQNHKDEHVHE